MENNIIKVTTYLLQHKEGLITLLKSEMGEFLEHEQFFKEIPDVFQTMYEEMTLKKIYTHLIVILNMSYSDLEDFLDFKLLKTLWKLDEKGRW